jgi:hypothetical protein
MSDALPARLLATSEKFGWADVSVPAVRDDSVAGPFTTAASPDLLVVLITAGTYAIESHPRPPRSGPSTGPEAWGSPRRAGPARCAGMR